MSNGAINTNAAQRLDNKLNVVLAIPLSLIIEDENQPRRNYIIKTGKTLSVTSNAWLFNGDPFAASGRWHLYHYSRRYRASLEAELSTMSVIIQQ